jgi:hypothetical protein
MVVIAWTCHIGHEEFDHEGGGSCARCQRSTCADHLRVVNYNEKDGAARSDQIVCTLCVQPGETARVFERRLLAKSSWARVFGD